MELKKILLMSAAAILLPTFSLSAQAAEECTIVPTCSELGYSQKAAECQGKHHLKCPFNRDALYCGGDACPADFTLTSCDSSIGTCEECGGQYKYTACNNGWTPSNNTCIANSCSGYTLSSCPPNAYCSSCKSGTTTKYSFSSCYNNYNWNGSTCVYVNPCSGWNSSLSGYQTSYNTCKNGTTIYYKETACQSGKCTTACNGTSEGFISLSGNKCSCVASAPCPGNE